MTKMLVAVDRCQGCDEPIGFDDEYEERYWHTACLEAAVYQHTQACVEKSVGATGPFPCSCGPQGLERVPDLLKLSADVREYQRRITAAFTAMDRIMSIAPSELRPEGSKVHELMELSFARIRAALSGEVPTTTPNREAR